MSQSRHAVICLDILRDLESILARTAARAVGDAHKGWTKLRNLLGRVLDTFKYGVRLRREYLEGKRQLFIIKQFGKFHLLVPDFKQYIIIIAQLYW